MEIFLTWETSVHDKKSKTHYKYKSVRYKKENMLKYLLFYNSWLFGQLLTLGQIVDQALTKTQS